MVTKKVAHGEDQEEDPQGGTEASAEADHEVDTEVTYTGAIERVFVSATATAVAKPGDKFLKGMFSHPDLKEG